MPFDHALSARPAPAATRALARWLLAVAAMVWAMVTLGGLTRLTGSGLSIMEWAPLSGSLPPLSTAEWQRLFELYQQIPQYALLNQGFGLAGFQQIFWLEWAHRLWGRLIGLAFLLPLLWFWSRGLLPRALRPRLLLLFGLGGLQGAVGWFMVASGFAEGSTAVAPVRLVLHLGLALGLFAALLWTALGLRRPDPGWAPGQRPPALLRRLVQAAAGLLLLAMLAGGLVAGLHAGLDYNTFPRMDGQWVPAGYATLSPFCRNAVENIAAVQFHHRLLATLAGLAALAAGVVAWRLPAGPGAAGRARAAGLGLAAAALLQYGLGVATLLLVVPVWLGTLHQAVAVLLLATALAALHSLRPGANVSAAAWPGTTRGDA